MTCHLDWSLLDSTVTDALRDYINAKLDQICQDRIADYNKKQKEKKQLQKQQQQQQKQQHNSSSRKKGQNNNNNSQSNSNTENNNNNELVTVKPLTNVKVMKIWWGTEPPLLEIMEIDQAPPLSKKKDVQEEQKDTTVPQTASNQNLSTMTSPNTSFPAHHHHHHHQNQNQNQQQQSSTIFSSPNASMIFSETGKNQTVGLNSTSSFSNFGSTSNLAATNSNQHQQFPPNNNNNNHQSLQTSFTSVAGGGVGTTTIRNSTSRPPPQQQQQPHQNTSDDSLMISRQDSTTSSAAVSSSSPYRTQNHQQMISQTNLSSHHHHQNKIQRNYKKNNNTNHQNQQKPSQISARQSKAAFQHQQQQQNQQQSMDRSSFVSSSSTTPSGNQNNTSNNNNQQNQPQQSSVGPTSLMDAILGENGFQIRIHLVHSGSAGFEVFVDPELQIHSPFGALFGTSSDDGDDDESSGDDVDSLLASVRFPMLFDISDFHFDIVLNITIRGDEGIKVRIEPDRFGGEGAEGRILSSLSIVAKAGAGLLLNNRTGKRENNEEVLVDQECARSLVLKELRAVLARTLVQGIVVPLKK